MKAVIDKKVYDTEKAEVITEFSKPVRVQYYWFSRTEKTECRLYKTKNGAWFEHIGIDKNGYLNALTEEEAKTILAKHNPDKYTEIFNDWEEA